MAKKTSKLQDIRKLSDANLQKELDETYKRMFALRIKKETLQLPNHREIPNTRRAIARLKTITRQRELTAKGGRS